MYYDVVVQVEPKRNALREATETLNAANTKLAEVQVLGALGGVGRIEFLGVLLVGDGWVGGHFMWSFWGISVVFMFVCYFFCRFV